MSSVVVRPRSEQDLTALAATLVKVHALDGYPVEGVSDPVAWLTPPRTFGAWTAIYDDQPIGQIALTHAAPDDDSARIWHDETGGDVARLAIPARLFVDPDYRQHGAGGALMRTILDQATRLGLAVAFDVMLKDHSAIRLYEAAGAVRLRTFDHVHTDGRREPAAAYVVESPLS